MCMTMEDSSSHGVGVTGNWEPPDMGALGTELSSCHVSDSDLA